MARPSYRSGYLSIRSAGAVIRRNLLTNPSCEAADPAVTWRTNAACDPAATSDTIAGTNYAGWAASSDYGTGGSGTASLVTAASDGPGVAPESFLTTYLRKTWSAGGIATDGAGFVNTGGTGTGAGTGDDGVVVVAGDAWTVTAYVRASAAVNVAVRISWRDATGTYISSDDGEPVDLEPNEWTRVAATFVAPVGAARMCIAVDTATGDDDFPAGLTLDGTGLLVEATAAVLPYFDPAIGVDDADATVEWSGDENESPSEMSSPLVAGVTASSSSILPIRSTRWADEGEASLRLYAIDDLDDDAHVVVHEFDEADVGKTYTFVARAHLEQAPQSSQSSWRRAALVGQPASSPQVNAQAGTTIVRLTFSVATDGVQIVLTCPGGVGESIWWDTLTLVEGVYSGPPFSGRSVGDDDFAYTWDGEPDESQSIQHQAEWDEVATTIRPAYASPVIIAAPAGPPPNPAVIPGWDRMRITWIGTDGSVWRLSDPDGGVFLTRQEVRGLGMPSITHYRDQSPALNGAVYRDTTYDARSVFWPVHLFHDGSSREWVERDRAFWRSLHPRGTGVWTVEVPGVSVRSLVLRLNGDGDWAPDADPTFYGWANYGVSLQADDPLWVGQEVRRDFTSATPASFHGGTSPGDPIIRISRGSTLASASIANPGDEEAWPIVQLIGPFTTADVTIAGRRIEVPFSIAEGKSLTLDYRPAHRTAIDSDGNDRYEDLGAISWGAVPAGGTSSIGLEMSGTGGSASVRLTPLYLRAW